MPARNISHALTYAAITPKAKIDLTVSPHCCSKFCKVSWRE